MNTVGFIVCLVFLVIAIVCIILNLGKCNIRNLYR